MSFVIGSIVFAPNQAAPCITSRAVEKKREPVKAKVASKDDAGEVGWTNLIDGTHGVFPRQKPVIP